MQIHDLAALQTRSNWPASASRALDTDGPSAAAEAPPIHLYIV